MVDLLEYLNKNKIVINMDKSIHIKFKGFKSNYIVSGRDSMFNGAECFNFAAAYGDIKKYKSIFSEIQISDNKNSTLSLWDRVEVSIDKFNKMHVDKADDDTMILFGTYNWFNPDIVFANIVGNHTNTISCLIDYEAINTIKKLDIVNCTWSLDEFINTCKKYGKTIITPYD